MALLAIPLSAADQNPAPVTVSTPVIQGVQVETKNVFDPSVPGEDRWPFTWANVIHFRTRPHVVLRELLVKPGDPAVPALLEESERNLRALPFIKNAKVQGVPAAPPGEVNIIAQTQDTWTTQPQIDFGSEGGQNRYSAGLLEENLLGFGKTVSAFYHKNADGSRYEYSYSDPQLFGSRYHFSSTLVDGTNGNEQRIDFAHPFYSLETPTAGEIAWEHTDEREKTLEDGQVTGIFKRHHQRLDAFLGHRLNDDFLNVHRLSLRYFYLDDSFRPEPDSPGGTIPSDKKRTGPVLDWSFTQSNFIKETFIDKAQRIEDINLGHQTQAAIAYAPRAFGSDDTTLPFKASDDFGFTMGQRAFGLVSVGTNGHLYPTEVPPGGGVMGSTLYFANLNGYSHLLEEFPLTGVVHMETAYIQNPDEANQLQLGGDTGLRGYKLKSFTGNKSALVNLEGRFFYPKEILHLAYLGGAFFLDAGQVQPQGMGFTTEDIHANIGVGFRLATTRSTEGTVYRLDIAYALGHLQQDNRIIVSIAAGQGFKTSGNTYQQFTRILK